MPLTQEEIAQKERDTAQAVKDHFKEKGFWAKPQQEQQQVMTGFLEALNRIWGTNIAISLDFSNDGMYQATGGGQYSPQNDSIVMYKPSLLTAIHEWKHALQHHFPEYTKFPNASYNIPTKSFGQSFEMKQTSGMEYDAITWSHAIFHAAMPNLYEQSYQKGMFFHKPQDVFPLEIYNNTVVLDGPSQLAQARAGRETQKQEAAKPADDEPDYFDDLDFDEPVAAPSAFASSPRRKH